MFCHKCGNQVPDDAKFCSKCGADLSGGGNGTALQDNSNLTEPEKTRVLTSSEIEILEFYDVLQESKEKCRRIKEITKKINKRTVLVKIKGRYKTYLLVRRDVRMTLNECVMKTGLVLGCDSLPAVIIHILTILCFPLFYILNYDLASIMALCFLVMNVAWFLLRIFSYKENKEIIEYINMVLNCEEEIPSRIKLILSSIVHVIFVIGVLVMVYNL